MSFLSSLSNFVKKIDPISKNEPTVASVNKAIEAGNWTKPYGQQASAWDFLGAGAPGQVTSGGKTLFGALNPEKPQDRAIGRAAGTAVADYWTLGLFSKVITPGAPAMDLTTPTDGSMAYASLTTPGTLTATQSFAASPTSVTPIEAATAANAQAFTRWVWIAVVLLLAIIFLRKV